MRFLEICFALAWHPTWGGGDCDGAQDVISSLSATVDDQRRTISALEDRLSSLTTFPTKDPNWNVVAGACTVQDGCLHSPNWPAAYDPWDLCTIAIEENWTGYIDVVHYSVAGYDSLIVNGWWYDGWDDPFETPAGSSMPPLHGVVPGGFISWTTWDDNEEQFATGWRLCVTTSTTTTTTTSTTATTHTSHLWHVAKGSCAVDAQGCITSPNYPLPFPSYDMCNITVNGSAWTGRLIVTGDAYATYSGGTYTRSYYAWSIGDKLSVDGHGIVSEFGSCELLQTPFVIDHCQVYAAKERVPEKYILWSSSSIAWLDQLEWKICQGPPLNESGHPFYNQTWTCDATGFPVTFPRGWNPRVGRMYLPEPIQMACTRVWSDPDDLDGDGDPHNGWPYYYVEEPTMYQSRPPA